MPQLQQEVVLGRGEGQVVVLRVRGFLHQEVCRAGGEVDDQQKL